MLAQLLKQTASVGRFTTTLLALVVLIALFPTTSSGDGYIMQIQTTGSDFAPAAYIDGVPQTFLWNWSDGTTSADYPIAAQSFGSSGSRTQYLTVDLPSALTNFNIGYDASDDGDTNNYTMQPM